MRAATSGGDDLIHAALSLALAWGDALDECARLRDERDVALKQARILLARIDRMETRAESDSVELEVAKDWGAR